MNDIDTNVKAVWDSLPSDIKDETRKAYMVQYLQIYIGLIFKHFGKYPTNCLFEISPECCCGRCKYFTFVVPSDFSPKKWVDCLNNMIEDIVKLNIKSKYNIVITQKRSEYRKI